MLAIGRVRGEIVSIFHLSEDIVTDYARIRRVTLEQIKNYAGSSNAQVEVILRAVAQEVGGIGHTPTEQVMMDVLNELFLNGTLAPGYNLSNSRLPFFHLTERGQKLFSHLSRDPGDQNGYLGYLHSVGLSDPIALSYIEEAANAYHHSCYKSAAVMTGCSAERLVGMIRDEICDGLERQKQPVPSKLSDWRFKTMRDAITAELEKNKKSMTPAKLQEQFQLWEPYTEQLRLYRNDAGHPVSIAPITPETAHANLLIFTELAILVDALLAWIKAFYK
jgi:hypothetical protein